MFRLFFISSLLFFSLDSFAEDICRNKWEHLRDIQKQMNKRSNEYWRTREREAKADYQNCRKNKNNSSVSRRQVRNNGVEQTSNNNYRYYSNPIKPMIRDGGTLTLTGRFKGEKQEAWLMFFKRPKECVKPTSTSEFSKCIAFENQRAIEFEEQWQRAHPAKSFKLGRG